MYSIWQNWITDVFYKVLVLGKGIYLWIY